MANTEVLSLPELTSAQGNKFVTYNKNLRQLEAMTVRVISRTNGGPPGSPAEGDAYIVDNNTGAWSSFSVNDIAQYYLGLWRKFTPKKGVHLVVNDDENLVWYDGASWNTIGVSVSGLADGSVLFVESGDIAVDPGFIYDNANDCLQVPSLETTTLPTLKLKPPIVGAPYTPPSGVQIHYTMDNISGGTTLVDEEGNSNGTISGAIQTTSSGGQFDEALAFDGVNDYVSFAPIATDISDCTVSMWIEVDAVGNYQTLWSHRDSVNELLLVRIDTDNKLYMYVKGSTGALDFFSGSTVFSAGPGYYHIVGVFRESGTSELWVEGSLVGSKNLTVSGTINSSTEYLGTDNNGSFVFPFNGKIDHFRFWNRALSSGEIADVYANDGSAGVGSPSTAEVTIEDNASSAFLIKEGSTSYYEIDTTDSSEQVNYGDDSIDIHHKFKGTVELGRNLGNNFTVVNSTGPVVAGGQYWPDTSGGSFTLTLPATPSVNDTIQFADVTPDSARTGGLLDNSYTIDPNGEVVEEQATLTVVNAGLKFRLIYTGTTRGWIVLEG